MCYVVEVYGLLINVVLSIYYSTKLIYQSIEDVAKSKSKTKYTNLDISLRFSLLWFLCLCSAVW